MYFDTRLWGFTKGVRGRIAWSVLIGILAAAVGVARLAMLGWLLAMVFQGAPLEDLMLPFAAVAAVMVLRGGLEYVRIMIAHRTAAIVQLHIRRQLFDKMTELGPAYLGLERTGAVITSMVDGVEQLETYFGQYLPQLFVAALTPVGIFLFVMFLDLPVALTLTAFALFTLIAPQAFHRMDRKNSKRRSISYKAFAFSGPLFVTALAHLILGETVGWRRWSAVTVGFVGILIMLRPSGDAIQWFAMFPLCAACCGAFRDILTRKIRVSDSPVAILAFTMLAVGAAGLTTLPFGWKPVPLNDLLLLATVGIVVGAAQYLVIQAFHNAEASLIVPFKYLTLIWGAGFGYVIWGDIPDFWVIIGAFVVVGSGLYIMYRETRRRQT